jgi:hypothetical protein
MSAKGIQTNEVQASVLQGCARLLANIAPSCNWVFSLGMFCTANQASLFKEIHGVGVHVQARYFCKHPEPGSQEQNTANKESNTNCL